MPSRPRRAARVIRRLPPDVQGSRAGLVLAVARMQLFAGVSEEVQPAIRESIERLVELGDHELAAMAAFLKLNAMQASHPARAVDPDV